MFWTIQHRAVLEIIRRDGIYRPDFSLSGKPYGLEGSYSFVLNGFNLLNPQIVRSQGLVFSFDDAPERRLESIGDVREFFSVSMRREFITKSGMNEDLFDSDDYVLIQLDEYDEDIYTLPLDVSYFVWMSDYLDADGRLLSRSFQEADNLLFNLLVCWNQGNHFLGWMLPSTAGYIPGKPSNMMQYHLPWIESTNIVDVVPITDIS